MTIKIGQAKFCTDLGSPEIILLYLVPIMTIILLKGELGLGYVPLICGVLLGISIYFIISIVKNIVAKFMDSDVACRIPHFDIHE